MRPQHIDSITPLRAEPVRGPRAYRIMGGDPHGQGGEFAGSALAAFWLAAQLCGAFVAMTTANRPQAQRHEIAAVGGKRINARTPADKRQAKAVDPWQREL